MRLAMNRGQLQSMPIRGTHDQEIASNSARVMSVSHESMLNANAASLTLPKFLSVNFSLQLFTIGDTRTLPPLQRRYNPNTPPTGFKKLAKAAPNPIPVRNFFDIPQ
jgi:hypothetical protein